MGGSISEFDKWYEKNYGIPVIRGEAYRIAKAAWIEATRQEREACAKTCEELNAFSEDDPGKTAADAIRAKG